MIDCGFTAKAYEILITLLRDGLSIGKLGDDLIAQMDSIEETLRLADGGLTTHKAVQCVIDQSPIKNDLDLMTIWYTSVHILLKINRMKDDNMNGMVYRFVTGKEVILPACDLWSPEVMLPSNRA